MIEPVSCRLSCFRIRIGRSKEINITDKDNSLLYAIELNQTAFFPEGGGQCSDTGYMNTSSVYDVFKEDGRVYHVTDCSYGIDEVVSCSLDFEKRYSNMQNHSGEHLVCGLIHKLYGFDNVGFHLSGDLITVDENDEVIRFDITINIE